jgi:RNA polymerase sigma factor (sigma-70 family)
MRRVLIDLARRRMADRHGAGVQTLSLEEPTVQEPSTASPESIVAVGLLMDRFDQIDPQAAHVVNMIYFAGFSVQEVAAHTGWSERQVRSRWKKAQNWLKDRL